MPKKTDDCRISILCLIDKLILKSILLLFFHSTFLNNKHLIQIWLLPFYVFKKKKIFRRLPHTVFDFFPFDLLTFGTFIFDQSVLEELVQTVFSLSFENTGYSVKRHFKLLLGCPCDKPRSLSFIKFIFSSRLRS